jgi:DegV family protein with EDD domain
MDSIGVITDSICCLPQELIDRYHIYVVPAATIYYQGKTYRDLIDLSRDEAYNILESSPKDFFTGPTSPGEFVSLYRKLSNNYNTLIYVSLSSKLSTLYNDARVAKEVVEKDLPELRIEIIDSLTATAAQGFIALAAAKAALESKNIEDVLKIAHEVRKNVDLYYVLDTIKYVYRTGRVPRPVSTFGSMLNVKPLITIRNGSPQIRGLVRNSDRGIDSLVSIARTELAGKRSHMAVLHADAYEEAETLVNRLAAELKFSELWIGEFSPVMVYGTGKGVIGIAFYVETKPSA